MGASTRNISSSVCQESTIEVNGQNLCLHTWTASTHQPRGVCVIYHGFLAHSTYPTVRYAAELLSKEQYIVIAADLPGHGRSPGKRGYLASAESVIEFGRTVAEHGAALCRGLSLPLFLVGSSMGGTIALSTASDLSKEGSSLSPAAKALKGVVLLAPMLALELSPSYLRHVLFGLASIPIVSGMPLIPSSSTSAEKQYRDADKRKECEEDPLTVNTGSKILPASASTCVELANGIAEKFDRITVPFLCMAAKEDVVVDNSGCHQLMSRAPSKDKTVKEYDAMHGLLCEPSPLIEKIQSDLLEWIDKRSS